MMDKQVATWADVAMYPSAHNAQADEGELVEPRVYLVAMTPQPLRTMAAAAELYKGNIRTDPMDIDKSTAMHWFREMTRTKLQAPLEFIDLHFELEGVTRAFANQLVRQRTAVYVQESMRFAVKDNAEFEVAMPPTIATLNDDDPMRVIWQDHVKQTAWVYNSLVNGGIPAEDARGALLLNTVTRVHYKTNLRNLAEHSGLRLCSQAQYEWKQVWYGMIKAILDYGPVHERWQQREITKLFKPVCFQEGKCGFHAESDRFCSIRDRVDVHERNGDPVRDWVDIDPLEPLREGAARLSPYMAEARKAAEEADRN
jgi:flavin-dependent thymidylate synthase